MASVSERFVIAFNGEIYNHLEIRELLETQFGAIQWLGHSDTETLLYAIDNWGLEKSLLNTVGMFAFALWDQQESKLILARDRMGEKPLYYGWHQNELLFGSELKSLIAHPSFKKEINKDVLALYTKHFYIPAPYCIWQNTYKLLPGSYSVFSINGTLLETRQYWDAKKIVQSGKSQFILSAAESVDELESRLKRAVNLQMLSDVPLGAFLSGGVDSSTIVALMQSLSSKRVKTFSIGFHEKKYNEAEFAKAVASHLGTDHNELYVTANDVLNLVPSIPKIYDEPFADSSQLPTFLVMQMARQNVSVALSGDAGDELFGGYSRYSQSLNAWKKIAILPLPIRMALTKVVGLLPEQAVNKLFGLILRDAVNYYDKMLKARKLLCAKDIDEFYHRMIMLWVNSEKLVKGAKPLPTVFENTDRWSYLTNPIERMMARDMESYLPDDILAKVDRSAMAVSLETRVPLLDHRVVEHAWSMPLSFKINEGHTKWPLRQILYKYVPRTMIERPKTGFAVPMNDWLRGPLKTLAYDLLQKDTIRRQGIFCELQTERLLEEHFSGKRNWAERIWTLLVFQLWYKEYMEC